MTGSAWKYNCKRENACDGEERFLGQSPLTGCCVRGSTPCISIIGCNLFFFAICTTMSVSTGLNITGEFHICS